MTGTDSRGSEKLYLGVDVGGTKVQASLVRESGIIVGWHRCRTPLDCSPADALEVIKGAVTELLAEHDCRPDDVTAIGVAVAALLDPDAGRIVDTPNMNLSGMEIVKPLETAFGVPVALGNDTNMGTLGEKWLGAAREDDSVVGIFVGTGIGGGIVFGDRLWRGCREAGGELGHMIVQVDGPKCGCGKRGCLESLASRTAIQRDIRQGIRDGIKTVLTELLPGDDLSVIRSGTLRKALDHEDAFVTRILRRAAEYLGHGCVTVRNVIDPDVIVLGGGVMEACSDFMLPIVTEIVEADPYGGARPGGRLRLAALGDDSVVLGAVALARALAGRSPFDRRFAVAPTYTRVDWRDDGKIAVGQDTYDTDMVIRVDGRPKVRKANGKASSGQGGSRIKAREIAKVCRGGPEIVFVGGGVSKPAQLSKPAARYLALREIECELLPTPEAIDAYNRCSRRKAALLMTAD